MIRAILFDLGDTLLDFRPLNTPAIVNQGLRCTYDRLVEAGVRVPSIGRYHRGTVWAVRMRLLWNFVRGREMNALRLMRQRLKRMGAPDNDEFMHMMGWEWYKPLLPYCTVDPEVIPTLQMFRDAGLKMGVVSNTFFGGAQLDQHLEEAGLLGFFPVRIYSSEVGYPKPNPIIFRAAMDAIGTSPRETLFVGDMVTNDILGAHRMGMQTALRLRHPLRRGHEKANFKIHRISELVPLVLPVAEVAASPAA